MSAAGLDVSMGSGGRTSAAVQAARARKGKTQRPRILDSQNQCIAMLLVRKNDEITSEFCAHRGQIQLSSRHNAARLHQRRSLRFQV